MPDLIDSRGDRPTQGASVEPGEKHPAAGKAGAVSAALMAGKFLLDRAPSRARVELPGVAALIGDLARHPDAPAVPTTNPQGLSIPIEPSRVGVPEGKPTDESQGAEHPQVARGGPDSATGGRGSSSALPDGGPTTTTRAATLPALAAPAGVADLEPPRGLEDSSPAPDLLAEPRGLNARNLVVSGRPGEQAKPEARPSPTMKARIAGEGELQARGDAGPAAGDAGRCESAGAPGGGLPPNREVSESPARVAATSRLGRPDWTQGADSPAASTAQGAPPGLAGLGAGASRQSSPTAQVGSPRGFVRNPLSTDLGDFSTPGPALPSQAGPTAGPAAPGQGSGEPSPGGSSTTQGGAGGDLSKTNELLQQLIDAVRKQRGASLPPGGPSVYPDR